MIEIGAVASESTNLTLRPLDDPDKIDWGRQHVLKNEAEDVADVTMSFEDFLDMINPLEHIPVISSIYRAIVGENISPVSRIVGDTIYGGIMGPVSAGIAVAGAVGDEILAANNDGQTTSETVVAAVFGKDDASTTKVAQAAPDTDTKKVALAQTIDPAGMQTVAAPAATLATSFAANSANTGKGLPVDRSKMPFGGVMDSAALANVQQNPLLASAMAGRRDNIQAQRSLHNSRFAVATASAVPSAVATDPTAAAEPETQAAMQKLLQELQAMKGINQYKNAAQKEPLAGETVNIVN